jgi:hypothetical protein
MTEWLDMRRNTGKVADRTLRLQCQVCGNKDRFIEVMRSESHLVNGSLTYLRLLYAEADHYTCFDCGHDVSVMEFSTT